MKSTSTSPLPISSTPRYSKLNTFHLNSIFPRSTTPKASPSSSPSSASVIHPPPPDFNFKSNGILQLSKDAIAKNNPELLDLAEDGTLVLIEKSQFGPVPPWRSEFVEPDSIWIVGTTHVSRDSARDVERVLRVLRPENVVVELCRSRAGIMYISDNEDQNQLLRSSMFSLSGTGFFGAIGRSINLGGQTALALRLLLAAFSSKVSADINRPFGDEFRAARRVSEEIGAQLVLGDLPIEITLERAWKSLTWKEKLSLLSSVARGITSSDLSKIDTSSKEYSNDDSDDNFEIYRRLSLSYPSLLPPLLYERDTFLAWSLKRSKAVNGSKTVVGIIGKGHVNGVIYSLVSDQGNLRFKDLVGKKTGESNSWAASIAKDLLRDTVIGFLLWLLYDQLMKPSS